MTHFLKPGYRWIEHVLNGTPPPKAPAGLVWCVAGRHRGYAEYELREEVPDFDLTDEPAPPPARFDDLAAAVASARREGMYFAGLTLVLRAYREARNSTPSVAIPWEIRAGLLAAGLIGEGE